VYHLQEARGGGPLVNTALSGNTIGFNYGGDLSKNTLENLTGYLRTGYAELGEIDDVLISLGTNDCKGEFAERHDEIAGMLRQLVDRTQAFFTERGQDVPRIVLITPPPLDGSKSNANFSAATPCVEAVAGAYRDLAAEKGLCLVDLHKNPGTGVLTYSKDGVHFSKEGYAEMAAAILETCY
ncbi:MAG: GDSL-type esterase/lipase family protein, partial [Bacteroidota bacterium]